MLLDPLKSPNLTASQAPTASQPRRQLTPKLTSHQRCVTAPCVTDHTTNHTYLYAVVSATTQNINICMLSLTLDTRTVRSPKYLHAFLNVSKPSRNLIIYIFYRLFQPITKHYYSNAPRIPLDHPCGIVRKCRSGKVFVCLVR